MKLVAILGSPHGMKGNTGQLLQGVLDGARTSGFDVSTYSLADLAVRPCDACDCCHKTGKCKIKDDFDTLKNAMIEADAIVLASPNYIFSVSAQMKAVFDRCCGPLHCQLMGDRKYAAAVVTSGGDGSNVVEDYMLRFLQTLGCWTVGSAGAEARQLFDPAQKAKLLQSATELGKSLANAVKEKRTFPDQAAERKAFFERMKQLITVQKAAWPYEYEYWKQQGRL